MKLSLNLMVLALMAAVATGCDGEQPRFESVWSQTTSRVRVDSLAIDSPSGEKTNHNRPHIRDAHNRYVHFHGINLSGSNKFPVGENFPSLGEKVSYIGKPFPLDQADEHYGRLRQMGFNSVRLLLSWEAIQPIGPGKVDQDYLNYVAALVDKAAEHGIYVLLDMHQDIFSRHLFSYYNSKPLKGDKTPYPKGSIEAAVLSLVPPYDHWVRGDGAPRWVVKLCLPEKNLDSPNWGTPRLLGGIGPTQLIALYDLFDRFGSKGADGPLKAPEWVEQFVAGLPAKPFDITESSDYLPWTMWGVNGVTSLDCQRCFATLFAGDKIYPKRTVGGKNIKEFLQNEYARSWREVAKKVKGKHNVIGYDIMNEPIGFYLTMTAVAAFFQTGVVSSMEAVFKDLLGPEIGKDIFDLLTGLYILPADASADTIKKWGFEDADLMAMIDMNIGFDAKYLQPFYEKMGQEIQKADPDAIIWFEKSSGTEMLLGTLPTWSLNMTRPQGVKQAVFAPHWYPDIYPFIGINQPPRSFTPDEWKYRDFGAEIGKLVDAATYSFGNVPVVFGEFGTYYNYNGIEDSIQNNYIISSQILDAYYKTFEQLGISRMQWCYSPENSYEFGEGWNLEDFSIVDPDLKWRGHQAFVRPYARATSGKLVTSRFYSPLEFVDPTKGVAIPVGEFHLEMESKETLAPTEIFIPDMHYPNGFYVWVSDGVCYYDDSLNLLLWYPTRDEPEIRHKLTIRADRKEEGVGVHDWDYFFHEDRVLDRSGGVQ